MALHAVLRENRLHVAHVVDPGPRKFALETEIGEEAGVVFARERVELVDVPKGLRAEHVALQAVVAVDEQTNGRLP